VITQNVTFKKSVDTITRKIIFTDKVDGSNVASLTEVSNYNTEKIIFQALSL
jgi:hypothetical protein